MRIKAFLNSCKIITISAVVFMSCKGKDNKLSTLEKHSEKVDTLSVLTSGLQTSEVGHIPEIIRSDVPQGYYQYDRDDSQISQYIRRIFQDKNGNLWFGTTDDGVIRYDKKSLTYFSTREGLSGNGVFGILEDRIGNLWFATNGGVSKYDGKKFTNYFVEDGLKDNSVLGIIEDQLGKIWVCSFGGVSYLENERFVPFEFPLSELKSSNNHSFSKIVWSILQDSKGNIWFGTDDDGIYRYAPSANTSESQKIMTHFTENDGLCNNKVVSILEDHNGNIWFGSIWNKGEGGISCFNGKTFKTYSGKDGISGSKGVWSMMEDKNGILWLAARGVDRFDPSSEKIIHLDEKDGLSNIGVQSIFEDQEGNLWIGTGAGLFRYDGKKVVNQKLNEPWD